MCGTTLLFYFLCILGPGFTTGIKILFNTRFLFGNTFKGFYLCCNEINIAHSGTKKLRCRFTLIADS
jgi:hypothetical protein